MIWCVLQYIVFYANVVLVGTFCTYSLCCHSKENQYGCKIKAFILMPAFSSLFTAIVATYNFAHMNRAECIYFGSWVAMLSIDLGNQVLFIVGVVFINTMEIVFKKIKASRLGQSKDVIEAQIAKMKFHKNIFVAAFVACESAVLSLKGIIYLTDEDWS